MNEMALIVPSRGRPGNIERLLNALDETEAKVDLYVGVDADDPTWDQYSELWLDKGFYLHTSQERKRFGPTLNSIAMEIWQNYKYLMWCGDDHLPITKNWDKRYIDELEKFHFGMVYGNDLVMGERIATQLAFTAKAVGVLGYAVPEEFIHLYIDNYFMELFNFINTMVYLPDVIIQHLHPVAGKAQEDQTYREANSKENWNNDKGYFNWYVENKLQKDAKKLLDAIP